MKVRIEKFEDRIAILQSLDVDKKIVIPRSLLPKEHRIGEEYEMVRNGKEFSYELLNPEAFEKGPSQEDRLKKLKKK